MTAREFNPEVKVDVANKTQEMEDTMETFIEIDSLAISTWAVWTWPGSAIFVKMLRAIDLALAQVLQPLMVTPLPTSSDVMYLGSFLENTT